MDLKHLIIALTLFLNQMITAMFLDSLPRVRLAFLPTPIHKLNNVNNTIQTQQIFIKRDDLTGLALGGNKTRKLEYLLGDAVTHNIDTIVTAGAIQSNHCRQTAAAAARLGLRCELLLNGSEAKTAEGNVLLDKLFGAHIHWSGNESGPKNLKELAEQVCAAGHTPYIIPYGGSNEYGVLGYINAMIEFMEQQKSLSNPISHIFLASCSGATQVGLVIGAKLTGFTGKIIGISVDYDKSQRGEYVQLHTELANQTIKKFGIDVLVTAEDFLINFDYAHGYGKVGNLERNAINIAAQQEGILLDPVYSGRAFGAMLDMIENGQISKNSTILFWHTGGTPALFPYATELLQEQ